MVGCGDVREDGRVTRVVPSSPPVCTTVPALVQEGGRGDGGRHTWSSHQLLPCELAMAKCWEVALVRREEVGRRMLASVAPLSPTDKLAESGVGKIH